MGSTLVPYQADLLRAHFDHACLMLDGDFAGRHGTATIAPLLGARMPLTVIALEDGCQPDHLTPAAIRRLLRHSVGAPPSRQSRSPRRQESSHPCDHDNASGIGRGGQPDTQTPDGDRLESRR